jgi:hypothetical protein
MTKTPRTSSYLRYVTRHHASHIAGDRKGSPLQPARTLTWQRATLPFQDRATETMLSAQGLSARTGTIPLLQEAAPLSMPHATQPALPTTKTAQPVTGQETTPPSSTLSSRLHAPVAPSDSFPATEEAVRDQQSQVEIQPAPAKSTHMSSSPTTVELVPAKSKRTSSSPVTEEAAPTSRNQQPQVEILSETKNDKPGVAAETSKAHVEKKPVLRPLSRQQQEITSIPTNSRRITDFAEWESNTSARVPEPQRRPAALQQETQQHTAVHIGTIDIHIVPPAPPVPLPPARSTTARPHSTLSREMTSFIGLRQG